MAKIHVRARAVDMLGRQQIAGIPTAIHELFKNAHDAYAEHVEVDFFRSDALLIIRDDGFGMTRKDFEDRWLTLGTEHKLNANRDGAASWTGPREAAKRPIMGEKGIGRLAIAAIGPQVLVMTRAVRPDGTYPLVASLIHWGLFELPGIDIDAIDIPIEEVPDGKIPDAAVMGRLVKMIQANIQKLGDAIPDDERQRLLDDLRLVAINPAQIDKKLPGPSLRGDGFGTHFYIRPTYPVLVDDIDQEDEENASPLEKMLLGFSNTMMPDRPQPAIVAEFRDHREDANVDELIGGKTFFTPEEFESADHHIAGEIDDFGHFSGKVKVYDQPPQNHVIQWPKATGRKTECGSFRVQFAYVQGQAKDSRLPPDLWAKLSAKLNKIGGLYVYRDGIRILPYGNSDYDFLNIERRRTKSASDWFFSYRRILGAVEISYRHNSNLVEKAGREGFRANLAYRQFVSILENFFQRLAVDFFREKSQFGSDFNVTREMLNREAELLKKREKSTKTRRRELTDRLNGFFSDVEKGVPSAEADRVKQEVAERLTAIRKIEDADLASRALLDVEAEVRAKTARLTERITIGKPRGFGLNKTQQSDWSAYLQNSEKLQREVLIPLRSELDGMISEVAASANVGLDRRRRVTAGLEAKRTAATAEIGRLRRQVQDRVTGLTKQVDDTLRVCSSRLASETERIFIELGRTDTAGIDEAGMQALQQKWEAELDRETADTREILEALRDQFQTLMAAVAERDTLDATTAAIETRAEADREKLDQYVELAQVGMALGIVQHEFGNTVGKIRGAIRKLKPWADGTPELAGIYKSLREEFDHLDSYLILFTPLSRRLSRNAVTLSGEEIRKYLTEVFGTRLNRNKIQLIATLAFDRHMLHGYASTFLPSFVNIVDNAIYWIGTDKSCERVIWLDADDAGILISNGGPGIEHRVADRIFEYGETTKPGGRGMGLYLSREALRKENFDLTLECAGLGVHPCFRIAPRSTAVTGASE